MATYNIEISTEELLWNDARGVEMLVRMRAIKAGYEDDLKKIKPPPRRKLTELELLEKELRANPEAKPGKA